ncbi:bacteriorhodopsin [Microbacteriaceae bacterium VKM Ac-2855]|nr:bacteriorhodopsin [Microbacteriaceae bacterium VKM Ac-2855]
MIAVPWEATLTPAEHLVIVYFLAVAALALTAGFIRAVVTRDEVGSRYRTAVVARICVLGIAALSYGALLWAAATGYDVGPDGYVPNAESVMTMAPRYMDWSVTVPLLTVELLAVTTLSGALLQRTRFIAVIGSFLMIFAGFLGAFVFGADPIGLLIAGAVSSVFWIIVSVVLLRAAQASLPDLTTESALLLRNASRLLVGGWVVYPLVYVVPLFGAGGAWTTGIQIALCLTDVTVKLGFSTLAHRIAKLRTAEDVRAGKDVHPESIWISSIKRSDAGRPREVFLPADAYAHPLRPRPPMTAAVPAESDIAPDLT